MISLEKLKILTPLRKLPKNVRDLGKLIVAKALKSCPKSNKSPNLVTLVATLASTAVVTSHFCSIKTEKEKWLWNTQSKSYSVF